MATPQEAFLSDPGFWQFADRLVEKGSFPLLVAIGIIALVWRFGWPKFGDHPPAPPQPSAVVEALTKLQAEVVEMKDDTHDRLGRIEADLRILLDRGSRK